MTIRQILVRRGLMRPLSMSADDHGASGGTAGQDVVGASPSSRRDVSDT